MSVQQEAHDLAAPAAEPTGDRSGEDYGAVRTDSLVMFGAALGGALVGMLLTLMVLALINGGTLNFSGGARQIAVFEANLARVNENVGAISTNVDIVAERANALESELATVQTDLQTQLDAQAGDISGINDSLGSLDVTQQQFDLFMGALSTALTDMESVTGETAPEAAPEAAPEQSDPADAEAPPSETSTETSAEAAPETAEEAAGEPAEMPAPLIQANTDLGPDSLVVLFFADSNQDLVLGESETNLVGMTVSVLDANGDVIGSAVSGDAGAVFEGLEPGAYQIVIDDSLGYELLTQSTFDVTVGEDEGGAIVFVPVGTAAP